MKRLLFFIIFGVLFTTQSFAQTQFEQGDLLVIGVNVNNSACSSTSNDLIHFLTLKDIEIGTTIQITDNRYISGNTFAKNEGFYSFQKVGSKINKGQSFVIEIKNSMPLDVEVNGWKLIFKNSTFDLAGSGDQFIVFQNAEFDSSTGIVSGSNLKYLFGYNTKREWSTAINNNNSIRPDQLNCFYIDNDNGNPATSTNRSFRFFKNTVTIPLTKLEWTEKILNTANWEAVSSCSQFNNSTSGVFSGTLQIKDEVVDVDEEFEICSGDPFPIFTLNSYYPIKSYSWYRVYNGSTNIVNSGSFPTPYPTSITLDAQAINGHITNGTSYYYCEMTINIIGSSCPMKIKSKIFKVTVNPKPIISEIKIE